MGSCKTNPRKIPKTQADVDRAYDKGINDGCALASAIFLTVLTDKFNAAEHIPRVWDEMCKLSEEIAEGRVSVADLRHVLWTEYDIKL